MNRRLAILRQKRPISAVFQTLDRAGVGAAGRPDHAAVGEDGIRRRKAYARSKHMLAYCEQKLVPTVGSFADGRLHVGFPTHKDHVSALDLRPCAPWLMQLPQPQPFGRESGIGRRVPDHRGRTSRHACGRSDLRWFGAGCSILGSRLHHHGLPEQPRQPGRQPRHIGHQQHADEHHRQHRQRGASHLRHRLVEAVGGKQQVQPHRGR